MSNNTNRDEIKQRAKLTLIKQYAPALSEADLSPNGHLFQSVRRVKLSQASERARISFYDGSYIDAESGEVVAFSGDDRSYAARAAKRLSQATGDPVYHLKPTAQATPHGAAPPQRDVPTARAQRLASWWQGQGFQDVTATPEGVVVSLGPRTQLIDNGERVTVNGESTKEALQALTQKAKSAWGGEMELFGSDSFKNAAWLQAQRDGVKILGFQPSAETLLAWEAEKAKPQLNDLTLRSANTLKGEIGKLAPEQVAFIKSKMKAAPDTGSRHDGAGSFANLFGKKEAGKSTAGCRTEEPESSGCRV